MRSGGTDLVKNGLSVKPAPVAAVDEHAFLAGEGGDHRDVAVLEPGDEVVADLLVAHIVQQDAHAFVDHHVGVGELDDMRAGDQVVLAALVEDSRDHLAREPRNLAALRIDPDLDHVRALGGDLVDLAARGLGRPVVVAGAGRLHGREAVHRREHARAADVAGAGARLVLDDRIRIGRHAGGRGHAVERVLAHLPLVRRRPDMAVAVDDAGHDVFAGEVDDGGAGRRLHVAADGDDAAALHHDGGAALRGGAGAVDQRGVGEGGSLGGNLRPARLSPLKLPFNRSSAAAAIANARIVAPECEVARSRPHPHVEDEDGGICG